MPTPLETDVIVPNSRIELFRYFYVVRNNRIQALQCRQQGNIVDEYKSLFKATTVLMQTIPKHVSFKESRWKKVYEDLSKTLKDDIVRLEELKAMLNSGQVKAPLRAVKPGVVRAEASKLPSVDWNQHTPMVAGSATVPQHYFERISSQAVGPVAPAADPNDPFAASAAFSTLSLAPSAPTVPPQPGGQFPGVAALPDWVHTLPQNTGTQALTAKHDIYGRASATATSSHHMSPSMAQRPQYPSIQAPDPDLLGLPPQNIPLPPQEVQVTNQLVTTVPPPDTHAGCNHAYHPPPMPSSHTASVEDSIAQLPSAMDQMCNVYIHPAFMKEFLAYAQSNTRKGIESCGLLGGQRTPDSSAFIITYLILPPQIGEANTVEMINEEVFCEYMIERDLDQLGWIHTHPTQTCFLSSVDVHTQALIQGLRPEAMAIVMAPTDPRDKQKIFRLTTPGGLDVVSRCEQRGFHTHEQPATGQEIYEVCGHVYLDETASFKCADLR